MMMMMMIVYLCTNCRYNNFQKINYNLSEKDIITTITDTQFNITKSIKQLNDIGVHNNALYCVGCRYRPKVISLFMTTI